MDFMLFRHAWAKAGSAAAWAMYSRPTTAYRTFSPDRGRVFSVRRPVYGESRSGFVWLLPLLPPRHGRLLHCFARQSHSGFDQLLFLRRESAAGDWRLRFLPADWHKSALCRSQQSRSALPAEQRQSKRRLLLLRRYHLLL